MARLKDEIDRGRLSRAPTAVFAAENPTDDEQPSAFCSTGWHVGQTSTRRTRSRTLFSHRRSPVPGRYDPDKVVLFGNTGDINLFEQCCRLFDGERDGQRAFTLQESLLLYAVLLTRWRRTHDFTRRMRVLRNLLAASGPDEIRSQNMPGLLQDVEAHHPSTATWRR